MRRGRRSISADTSRPTTPRCVHEKVAGESGEDSDVEVGDEEIEAGTAQVRDLATGEQRAVPLADLADVLVREDAAAR